MNAPGRSLLCIAISVASFLLVARAIRALRPWPSEYGQRAKFEYFADHKDEFEAIFVGTSVTAYGVVPQVFDEVLRERGRPMRSFNFGVGAMSTLEADHLLRRVLELEPASLEWVFVESAGWDPRLYYVSNLFAARTVRWHDVLHTRYAIECLPRIVGAPSAKDGPYWKWWTAWTHLLLMGVNLANVSQGTAIVRALLSLDADEVLPTREDLERLAGYVDLDVIEGDEWRKRRERFLAEQRRYYARVAAIDGANASFPPVQRHANLGALADQLAAITAAGARAVYYSGPRTAPTPMSFSLERAGLIPNFLAFNQPAKYPELYEPAAHFDPNHLTRAGAEAFTRLLATEFADTIDR